MTSPYDTKLFLDESGECSFSAKSAYKHFSLTVLSIPSNRYQDLKNCFKRQTRKLIASGWDKGREPKAATVYRNRRFGAPAVKTILESLTRIDGLRVSYLVVNKEAITHRPFRDAEYGIQYNYFSGVLLSEMVLQDGIHSGHLTYDARNKETNANMPFCEYIRTKIIGKAFEADAEVRFDLKSDESHICHGLAAVDYFSWAVFRKFEYGDLSYVEIFERKLLRRRESRNLLSILSRSDT